MTFSDSPVVPACDQGLTDCDGDCVDLDSDDDNCGGCGQACASGQTCRDGSCQDAENTGLQDEDAADSGCGCRTGADAESVMGWFLLFALVFGLAWRRKSR
ncbi:MAG: MYXO-CTERM sorting domain-containing protein [Deltaproteobacteria bacterium]|nr:MYXO-CTERM sorting domain-containing protein [Deltaproteobacteria bacterium]